MALLDLLQWPAMAVTIAAAWCVTYNSRSLRNLGFWLYLASNALWVTWGLHSHAYALIVLQMGLVLMNLRGASKTGA